MHFLLSLLLFIILVPVLLVSAVLLLFNDAFSTGFQLLLLFGGVLVPTGGATTHTVHIKLDLVPCSRLAQPVSLLIDSGAM